MEITERRQDHTVRVIYNAGDGISIIILLTYVGGDDRISDNLVWLFSYCYGAKRQDEKGRISIAKEEINRKGNFFCGPLKKKLKKRLVKCFVWNAVLYGAEIWTLPRSEEKRPKAYEMWNGAYEMDRQNNK
ncbi:hypothetical protein ANN_12876 [Periplaneta americana]|uniref:Uncharacterized protein n=1 Tax=Periplaneta americana TaxID=6978 RepID=A0ABQ8TIU3_PERAM|nr:hypothetical protein ANN_12876 [Periplaneta americana]